MTTVEIVAIAALESVAVYKQTKARVFKGRHRLAAAAMYALVGVLLGVELPRDAAAFGVIAVSVGVSVAVGAFGGRHIRLWRDRGGRVYSRGTALTIALLIGLLGFKLGAGWLAALAHLRYHSSIGEILLMIGVMLAVENYVVWRRVQRLRARSGTRPQPNTLVDHVGARGRYI
jgi:uncharacterized membrane protein YfcA